MLLGAASVQADFVGLVTETQVVDQSKWVDSDPRSLIQLSVYAEFDDPGDTLLAVFGTTSDPLVIETSDPSGFFQSANGGVDTTAKRNSALEATFPSMTADSWITIGLTDMTGNDLQDVGINFTDFNAGGSLTIDNGTWFITPDDPQGHAGNYPGYRVLITKLTAEIGSIASGMVNMQWIDSGGNGTYEEGVDFSVHLGDDPGPHTWTVDDDGPADFDNIQAAVDVASDGDEIVVEPGAYTGTGDEVVDMFGKSITLRASGTAEETIIDGEDSRRGITCDSGETVDTRIEGFTITHCVGSGIACVNGSSPTLTGCTISGNTSSSGGGTVGGGISCYGSNPTITDCTISDNTANFGGGGISCGSSDPTITGCTISGNTTSDGGGIYCYDGSSPTLTDCTISDNTAADGGGIVCLLSSPTLTNCEISGNTAISGGGIYCYYGSPTLTDCTILGNTTAGDGGGGIYCVSGSPTITDCTITGNTTDIYGGGMYFGSSSPTISGCTITNNTATAGGGIYSWNDGGTTALADTSVCCNTPDQIGGTWTDGGGNHVADGCIDDCNCNEVSDLDDVADGTSYDCDGDLVPDECEIDCDGDGVIDDCDSEPDQDDNGVPDNCDPDCNGNDIADGVEILFGWADDCDGDVVPDECQLADGSATDCDEDGTLDHCQITADPDLDCDEDGAIDSCAIADGSVEDCNENDIPDSCDIDNGGDANGDGVLDECECVADVAGPDGPGIPDGIVGTDDLLAVIGYWGSSIPDGDVNGDGIVGTDDLLAVISDWGPCE